MHSACSRSVETCWTDCQEFGVKNILDGNCTGMWNNQSTFSANVAGFPLVGCDFHSTGSTRIGFLIFSLQTWSGSALVPANHWTGALSRGFPPDEHIHTKPSGGEMRPRPLFDLLHQPRIIDYTVWISRWSNNWQGKDEYSENIGSSANLNTTNTTWPDLGRNPGCRSGRPATKHLSHGTVANVN
jgi:hypothetical protein